MIIGFRRLLINEDNCIKCYICSKLYPEVFEKINYSIPRIKRELLEKLPNKVMEELIEACPVDAISFFE